MSELTGSHDGFDLCSPKASTMTNRSSRLDERFVSKLGIRFKSEAKPPDSHILSKLADIPFAKTAAKAIRELGLT